jgi:hypothetical protein
MYSDSPKSQQQRQKFLVRDIIEVSFSRARSPVCESHRDDNADGFSRQALAGGTHRTESGEATQTAMRQLVPYPGARATRAPLT